MKAIPILLVSFLAFALTGCGVVEAIFKAGMWWALFLVAVLVGVVLYFVMKARRK